MFALFFAYTGSRVLHPHIAGMRLRADVQGLPRDDPRARRYDAGYMDRGRMPLVQLQEALPAS